MAAGPIQHIRSWFQNTTIILFFLDFTCVEMGPPLRREESDHYWEVTAGSHSARVA
jgi:hypothetical protein